MGLEQAVGIDLSLEPGHEFLACGRREFARVMLGMKRVCSGSLVAISIWHLKTRLLMG